MEKLLNTLLDNLPAFIYWTNELGIYQGCNKKFSNLMEPHDDQDINFDQNSYFKKNHRLIKEWEKNNLVALKNKENKMLMEEFALANGESLLCQSHKILIKDDQHNVHGLLNVSFQMEREFLNSDDIQAKLILQTLLSHFPGHLYWQNKEGIILGCNQSQAESLGYQHMEEVVGKHPNELIPKAEAHKLIEILNQIITSGHSLTLEEKISFKQGTMDVLSQKIPLFNAQGNPVGIMGISLDMTDLKQAQMREKAANLESKEAKIKANAEEHLRQAVMILTGSIAHDLRTPLVILESSGKFLTEHMPTLLSSYKTVVEEKLLENASPIPQMMQDYLLKTGDQIKKTAREMNDFIDVTLKTLSKVVKNELSKDDLTVCSMWHCIHNSVFRYPFIHEQRKLIHWDQKDFKFMGNELMTIRVFYNFIKNSLEQIEKNQSGEIKITTEITEEKNIIRFRDTAGGAPPEIVAHLFDGYQTTKEKGTGIGLAFCKMTIESFGGEITCESIYGEYIEFTLTFPPVPKENSTQ